MASSSVSTTGFKLVLGRAQNDEQTAALLLDAICRRWKPSIHPYVAQTLYVFMHSIWFSVHQRNRVSITWFLKQRGKKSSEYTRASSRKTATSLSQIRHLPPASCMGRWHKWLRSSTYRIEVMWQRICFPSSSPGIMLQALTKVINY